MQRRDFLKNATATAAALSLLGRNASFANESNRLHVTLNQYTVATFYGRDGIDFLQDLDKYLAEMKAAGADGLEVMLNSAADSEKFGAALKKNGMEMRSVYMSPNFHDKSVCDSEIERVLTSVKKAAEYGTKFVVVNPAVKEGKTDAELILQSEVFDKVGAEIRKIGPRLTFHYHTSELQFAGREIHHVLCGTNPENLGLCFDVHWSYRASGNSAVAAYDHARLYGNRVLEFHLRQSKDGVWTELFEGDGDLDYKWVADFVAKFGKKPHIVLEQAPENGTPKTMAAAEVFKKSIETTRKIFDAYR